MPQGYELGLFVQQIAEHDDPRAVILDFLQGSILVHPKSEDGTDTTEFTVESLMFLLSSVERTHTDAPLDEVLAAAQKEDAVTLCVNPEREGDIEYEGDILWTKLVETEYALLATRSSDQEWRIVGLTLPHNPPPSTT
jgi:hypothetical protein